MIDIHAHLNFQDYREDLEQIINRAVKAGVSQIICVSSNIADSKKAIKIACQYPNIVFAGVGIHPQQTDSKNKTSLKEQIEELKLLASQKEVACIAECGLDYSPAPPEELDRPKKDQYYLLEAQLQIAKNLNLPAQIHSRKAYPDTLAILQNHPSLAGVWHCYSEGKKGIEEIIKLGFYFGVDGNLTYDSGLQNVFSLIPLEKILLETDAPFLTPEPHRGERNEPSFLPFIAKTLGKIKKKNLKEIDRITTQNGRILFPKITWNMID
ncbi:TatD family hydrolase [Candidatus Shapirobacteria bacterium]|nr:TatD family hydrolase [Candidatus Shapirobacteria bacterium]